MTNVSPDVSQYIDLTVFDADATTLVAQAVLAAQQSFPGWVPLEGNTEMVVYEELALIITQLVAAVNRLPGATVATLLQLFGITQGVGLAATATVTFTLVDTSGYTIPAGTQLGLTTTIGTATFVTVADLIVAAGASTGTTAVVDQVNEAAPNGLGAGTAVTVVDQLYFVNTAVLATAVAGGADPETSQAWLARGTGVLQGINTTLAVPSQFAAAALADIADGVFRAFTVDNWNPAANAGAGGPSQGYVTVAVMGEGGSLLSSGAKGDVQSILEASSVAGLAVSVVDPTITTVPVTVTVWQLPGYTVSQVQANVAAALTAPPSAGGAGLSTDVWPWNQPVRVNDLMAVISNAAGVSFVVSGGLTAPAADVVLIGAACLATLGAVAVIVQGP